MENQLLMPGDSTLIENIVNYLKAKGIFDEFRHECLADVDTKPSCQNLSQRVDGFTSKFLATETWHPDMNKNELRNKLRRHIDESGMLTIGADHVVEQVINPKIGHLFYPRIREIVPQYLSEEKEKLNKKLQVTNEEVTEKGTEYSDANSSKTSKPVVLDPIADILAFSSSKSKPTSQNVTPVKTENLITKNLDGSKLEKKKDDKYPSQSIKSELLEKKKDDKISQPVKIETTDKKKEEKISLKVECTEKKKDEVCITSPQIKSETVENEEKCLQVSTTVEILEKVKEEKIEPDSNESTISTSEIKQEDNDSVERTDIGKQVKLEDTKQESLDSSKVVESSVTTGETQNKPSNIAVSTKSNISSKKFDKSGSSKSKLKLDISSAQKSSSSINAIQKLKTASKTSKSSEKFKKHSTKLLKSSKDSLPPLKKDHSLKSPKDGEISIKKKSDDSISKKTTDSSIKKSISKHTSIKKDIGSKHKTITEKSEKHKTSKSDQQDASSTAGKNVKSNIQYSSSYDSSQGSDQERSINIMKKERQKHFSKSVKKENSDKKGDQSLSGLSLDKHSKDNPDPKHTKKVKLEKMSKMSGTLDRPKESKRTSKTFSRSSSFGSTSSVSSLSSVSKDVSTSEESAESPAKKIKKKAKETSKDKCHNSDRKFQPPPPPPPPSAVPSSSSFPSTDEMQSSQSSQEDKDSDSESVSNSSSDSDIEESTLCNEDLISSNLNDTALTSSTFLNDINDIFLYSSSSSEFEGFCSSPEKREGNERDSDDAESVSSVHTSDLSSYDDEISVGDISSDESINDEIEGGKMTLEKVKEILDRKEKELVAATKKKPEVEEEYIPPNNMRKHMHTSSEDDVSSLEPKRTLRRERKLNPKYASNEYTSIYTSKIKSFITKQDTSKESKSPKESVSNNVFNKPVQEDVSLNVKASDKSSPSSLNSSQQKNTLENSEQCKPLRAKNSASASIRDTDKKYCRLKRKLNLDEASENPVSKRPCSRSSIDSTSSEFAANENKPFNNETVNSVLPSEKLNNIQKESKETAVISDNLKKDVPYKHKANNNGDVLNKIEPLKKNSQSKVLSNNEKKDAESNLEVSTS